MKNGKEMAKQNGKARYAKDDMRYWKARVFRPTYSRAGVRHEVNEYTVRIQYRGRREIFALGVSNKEIAGEKAKQIYLKVIGEGWDAALAHYKGEVDCEVLTVGQFLEEAKGVCDISAKTFADYARAFREIVADISGIKDEGNTRYSYRDGRREEWLAKVHAIPLGAITPGAVQKWRLAYVEERRGDPERERKAKTSCDTRIRCARSLFSERRVLRHLENANAIENPFADVSFFPPRQRRYASKFDAETLLVRAQETLMKPQDAGESTAAYLVRTEAFKALVMFAFTGLRRRELDLLLWEQVNLDGGYLDLRHTKYFAPKVESAVGRVPLDEQAIVVLRGFRARAPQDEFVLKGNEARPRASYAHYRAAKTLGFLRDWLRSYELPDGSKPLASVQKPLHEIRKEVGAILTTRHGIYAAKTMLRHADISTTASYYADQKDRVTVGIKLVAES